MNDGGCFVAELLFSLSERQNVLAVEAKEKNKWR